MDSPTNRPSWESKWRFVAIYAVLIIVTALVLVVVAFSTDFLQTSEEGQIPPVVWLALAIVFLIAILKTLSQVLKILDAIQDNSIKLERLINALEKNQSALTEISQSTHLSEAAKAIVFHDGDREFLIESVLNKLEGRDFDGAYEIIDGIELRPGYKELARHLRTEADKRRGVTDKERIEQDITSIVRLLESNQWTKASTQIEKLIRAYPNSGEARAMQQRLIDKKDERKKVLLNAWDDAVKRRATDRSLEILKELDLYLTQEEGLALQETARHVFKDKLHNLGVQFSLAVSGEQWDKSIQIGQEIIHDFPNSRMSVEIRERMDVLKQKVQLKGN